ncbi:MAG: CPBP family intramembrane glutamic endopeptidase [Pirellulaceae bacterium]
MSLQPPPSPFDPSGNDPADQDASLIEAEFVMAEAVEPKPRLWTLWIVLAVVIVFSMQASFKALLLAQAIVLGTVGPPDESTLGEIFQSRIGFCLLLIPSQVAILIPALAAAWFSPESLKQRLGLVRGHWPVWVWGCAAIATPLVGLITSIALGQLVEESEHLRQMSEAFREHSKGGFLVVTLLLVGGLPASCEELLFRGYLQTRLAARLPAAAAIILASLFFATFHFDPVHIIAVFPIGVWLGFVRHAAGSIFPAMLAHLVNNVLSVISLNADDAGALDAPATAITLLLLMLGLPCFLATFAAAKRFSAGT